MQATVEITNNCTPERLHYIAPTIYFLNQETRSLIFCESHHARVYGTSADTRKHLVILDRE